MERRPTTGSHWQHVHEERAPSAEASPRTQPVTTKHTNAAGRRSGDLREHEDAARGQLETRLYRFVDRVERERLAQQRSELDPSRRDVLEQDR